MAPRLSIVVALLLGILVASCGGGSDPTPADQTYEAARAEAEQTPVSDSMREYAQQLCDPMQTFLANAGETFEQLDEQATTEATPEDFDEAFGELFEVFGELEEPFQQLRDDMEDVDPPSDLQDYHEAFLGELDSALLIMAALRDDGVSALLAAPTPAPTPEEPEGFEAGLLQECGPELKEVVEQFDSDFFGGSDEIDLFGGDDDETATPLPPGEIGDTIAANGYELTVNSYQNPYAPPDDFFEPEPGQQWILFDVSITNVSEEDVDYGTLDFTVRDSDDFSYDTTYVGEERGLSFGSLRPGETVRGEVGFELPVDAHPDLLIYEPGFFGETRIDIELP